METEFNILVVNSSARNKNIFKTLKNINISYENIELFKNKLVNNFNLIIIDFSEKALLNNFDIKEIKSKYKNVNLLGIINIEDRELEEKLYVMGFDDVIYTPIIQKILECKIKKLKENLEFETNKKLIHFDNLTGIYNRKGFFKHTRKLLDNHPNEKFIILHVDIKNFKLINDLFGNLIGDKLLITLAKKIEFLVGANGTYGRMNADNFVICMPANLYKLDDIETVLTTCTISRDMNYNFLMRIGIYNIEDKNLSINYMCNCAKIASKTHIENNIKPYTIYNENIRKRMIEEQEIVNVMEDALKQNQFCVFFQPIYSITKNCTVGAEALVRWNHPEKGIIVPNKFVPIFEKNGFICKLDLFVWEECCKFLKKQIEQKNQIVPINVNLSRIDVYNKDICNSICKILEKYEIPTKYFKFEITETTYMENPEQLKKLVCELHDRGFEVAMDDFGSGYSSLNLLKNLPVDYLKIDINFIKDIGNEDRAGNILSSIVRMAKWLNIKVVAEGVETKQQLDFLKSIGCDKMQGYYYSVPINSNKFVEFLKEDDFLELHKKLDNEDFNFDSIWNSNSTSFSIINRMIGAVGVYELKDDTLEVVRVNDKYYEMLNTTPNEVFNNEKKVIENVYPKYRKKLYNACLNAMKNGNVEQLNVLRKVKNNNVWIDARIVYIGKKDNCSYFYFVGTNVTNQIKNENSKNLVNHLKTLKSIYNEIYEINYTDNKINLLHSCDNSSLIEKHNNNLKNYIEYVIDNLIYKYDKNTLRYFSNLNNLKKEMEESNNSFIKVEFRILKDDKKYHWICKTIVKQDNIENKDIFLFCFNNIDEQKNADILKQENRKLQECQRAEERYKIIVEQTGIIIVEWDFDKKSYFTSESYKNFILHQYDIRTMVINNIINDAFYPKDKDIILEMYKKIRRGDKFVSVDVRLKKTTGDYVWCNIAAHIVRHENGVIKRAIGTIKDVNEKIILERENKKQNEIYKMLVDTTDMLIFDFVPEKEIINIISTTPAGEKKCFIADANYDSLIKNEIIHVDYRCKVANALKSLCEKPNSIKFDYLANYFNTGYKWYKAQFVSLVDENNIVYRVVGSSFDINDEKLAQEKLENEKEYLNAIASDSLFVYEFNLANRKVNIIHKKASFDKDYYKFEKYIFILDNLSLLHPDDQRDFLSKFSILYKTIDFQNGKEFSSQYRIKNRKGEWVWVENSIYLLEIDSCNTRGIGYFKEISDRKILERKAEVDGVTNLYNRLTTEEKITENLEKNKEGYFILCDVDNFKTINDTYGHLEGDKVLSSIALILKEIYPNAVIGRIGGDEYVVFTIENDDDILIEKTNKCLAKIVNLKNELSFVKDISISVGISKVNNKNDNFNNLYLEADTNLYKAKNGGKNKIVFAYDN